jgi:hypothetical protein
LLKGAFTMAVSSALGDHAMPRCWSYSSRPSCHNRSNTPARVHSWKRRCALDEEHIPVAESAFH